MTWTDQALDGGTTNNIELGGNLTYNLNWDLMRADILPGALITLRAESRWGSSGMLNTGSVVPMNTAALTPTNYTEFDEGYGLALTQLSYLQMLSTKFGLLLGKLDLFGDGGVSASLGARVGRFVVFSIRCTPYRMLVCAGRQKRRTGVLAPPWHHLQILLRGAHCQAVRLEHLEDL